MSLGRSRRAVALAVAATLFASLAVTGAAGADGPAFVSDDFNRPMLGTAWTIVDPVGDGTVAMTGAGTGDAQVRLTVPSGVSHDPWNANNRALRVMRAASDADFTAVTRFGSVPNVRYQLQGLLVQQDADNWLRFEVHHNGSSLRAYAVSTAADVSTKRLDQPALAGSASYLKVARVGDAWTMSTSSDGNTWNVAGSFTHAFDVTSLGPFAGNSGSPAPGFTAIVDYLFEASSPIVPEDGASSPGDVDPPVISSVAVSPSSSSAAVTWTTNEPATSSVSVGTTTQYGLGTFGTSALATTHSVTVPGLSPSTTYHYRVSSTDGAGLRTTTSDATFVTSGGAPAGAFVSDDFNRAALAPVPWTAVNPRGDGTVTLTGAGTEDAWLRLAVPGGTAHDPWNTNNALRLMQPSANENFTAELKFASAPTQKSQMQGLIVEQDSGNWLRFDFHHNGSSLRAFAATTTNGVSTQKVNTSQAVGAALWLRVERTGDSWVMRTSTNGTTWTQKAAFAFVANVTKLGPFAGNSGSPVPAHTALVDYVFNAAAPVVPEDTPGPVAEHTLTTTTTGQGSIVRNPNKPVYDDNETVTLTAVAGSGWTFSGWSGGLGGQQNPASLTMDADKSVTATFVQDTTPGPDFAIWYGDNQIAGAAGIAQARYNVLGNVSDSDGIAALSYTVNGSAARSLTVGPNQRRLQYAGDFNADVPFNDLSPGANAVRITARDGLNNTATKVVNVQRVNNVAGLPYSTNWANAGSIGSQAQVVDGNWAIDGATIRPSQLGYDRLVAIGDTSWHDYEVTVPVTPRALGPLSGSPLSGPALFGLGLNWQGHTQRNNEQPPYWWYPTGAFTWFRWLSTPKLQLHGNDDQPSVSTPNIQVNFNTTYMLKARSDTVGGGVQYSVKLWPQGSAEPANWALSILEPAGPATGSVVLIAHQLDVQFGNVTVTPIP